jgi:hypothetical protein
MAPFMKNMNKACCQGCHLALAKNEKENGNMAKIGPPINARNRAFATPSRENRPGMSKPVINEQKHPQAATP